MAFKLLGGGSDLPNVVSDMNQNILELKGRETTEIFKDDSGTRRVLLGKGANGFYGLKVSPEGTDVYTAGDEALVFNSNNNVFKIVMTGNLTVNYVANSYQGTATLTHNLGYVPAFIAYLHDPPNYYQLPYLSYVISGANAGKIYEIIDVVLSDTELLARVTFADIIGGGFDANSSVSIKYYLLQETAN